MGRPLHWQIMDLLRSKLRHSVWIKSLLYRVIWLLPERFRSSTQVRLALKRLAELRGNDVFFLNIGANDGIAGDPMREFVVRHKWRGVLVEPVAFVFRRLENAYKGMPGIKCENAAIGEVTGSKTFWHLKKNNELPPGYDQIGSFNKEQVLQQTHLFPGLERFVTSTDVPCLAFADLVAKHGLDRIDAVLIDTEGHDYEIVKQIGPSGFKPSLIIFEHSHLSESDRKACFTLLQSMGYKLQESGGNTVASRSIDPAKEEES